MEKESIESLLESRALQASPSPMQSRTVSSAPIPEPNRPPMNPFLLARYHVFRNYSPASSPSFQRFAFPVVTSPGISAGPFSNLPEEPSGRPSFEDMLPHLATFLQGSGSPAPTVPIPPTSLLPLSVWSQWLQLHQLHLSLLSKSQVRSWWTDGLPTTTQFVNVVLRILKVLFERLCRPIY